MSDWLANASFQVQGDPESATVCLVIVIIWATAAGILSPEYSLTSVHKAKYYNKINTYS